MAHDNDFSIGIAVLSLMKSNNHLPLIFSLEIFQELVKYIGFIDIVKLYHTGNRKVCHQIQRCKNIQVSAPIWFEKDSPLGIVKSITRFPFVDNVTAAHYCACEKKCVCYTTSPLMVPQFYTIRNPLRVFQQSIKSITLSGDLFKSSMGELNSLAHLKELSIDFVYDGLFPQRLESLRCICANKSQLESLFGLRLFGWRTINQKLGDIPQTVNAWETCTFKPQTGLSIFTNLKSLNVSYLNAPSTSMLPKGISNFQTKWLADFMQVLNALDNYPDLKLVEKSDFYESSYVRFVTDERTIYMKEYIDNRTTIIWTLDYCKKNKLKFIFYEIVGRSVLHHVNTSIDDLRSYVMQKNVISGNKY